jgi:hypothetical protein
MKKKVIIPIRSNGKLSEHGYHDVRDKSELARHRALAKVIRAGEPPLGLFRRLNVLMILFRTTDPKLSKIFKADRNWVKSKYM